MRNNEISKIISYALLLSFSHYVYAVPVTFFTDRPIGLTTFRNAVNDADLNHNTINGLTGGSAVSSTVYSFNVPDTSGSNGVFSVTAGSTNIWIRTTQAGSPAPNDVPGNLGGTNFTGWGVSYANPGVNWANALAEGYKVEFFSDAGLTTRAGINSFGIHIDDWGTCCQTGQSATPTGTTTGTGVYLVFDNGSVTNALEVGTLTTGINRTEHFVGAIDDRDNNFNSITLVPTGIGEYFGVGSAIYFSTVQISSAVSSSGVNTVTSTTVDITSTHNKSYTDLGTSLNRVFAGGVLVIPTSAGATFSDTSAFTVNNVPDNTIQIDPNVTATFSGIFSGTGSLTKTGTGILNLSGANTYTGTTTVDAGTLLVGSSSSESSAAVAGSASVASGATIAGYGTIGAADSTLTNSGVVSPGNNSIATLSVGGAYVQNTDGNLSIGLNPSANDLLAVS